MIVLTVMSAMWGVTASEPFMLRAMRDVLFDSYQRIAPRIYAPDVPVRVVAIDEASLKTFGQWPWPRETLATLVETLNSAKPAAIALDMLLAEPERKDRSVQDEMSSGEKRFIEALKASPSVIGQAVDHQATKPVTKAGWVQLGDDALPFLPTFGGVIRPLEDFSQASQGVGALNWTPDRDLIIRRVPTLQNVQSSFIPSLALEALRVAQGASSYQVKSSNASGESAFGVQTGVISVRVGDVIIPTDKDGAIRIRYAGSQPHRHLSVKDLLEGRVDLARLGNHILLVGATANALSDIRATPLESAVPGIDVHAEALENILTSHALHRPDYALGLEIIATGLGAVISITVVLSLSPVWATALCLMLVASVGVASFGAFLWLEMLFDPLPVIIVMTFTCGVMLTSRLSNYLKQRKKLASTLDLYFPPEVARQLMETQTDVHFGGTIRDITVMFCDIRGFTQRSETMNADDVARFLKRVHTPLSRLVLEHGGTIDKFIGDGLMAFWNAPLDVPNHSRRAVECARAMLNAMTLLDQELAAESLAQDHKHTPLTIGIGLHAGQACVGNLGSEQRFTYSAVGDTVNTTARLEPLTKDYATSILMSETVACALPEGAAYPLGDIILRGRTTPLKIYGVAAHSFAL